jgi:hypothetical protein
MDKKQPEPKWVRGVIYDAVDGGDIGYLSSAGKEVLPLPDNEQDWEQTDLRGFNLAHIHPRDFDRLKQDYERAHPNHGVRKESF